MKNDNTSTAPTDPTPTDPKPADPTPTKPTDLDDLALSQDFDLLLQADRVLTEVLIRKPAKYLWVRTHDSWSQTVITMKLDDLWILAPAIVSVVPPTLLGKTMLVPYITRQSDVFVWPLRVPKVGQEDAWARTALTIAHLARTTWVQVSSNQRTGTYEHVRTPLPLEDPDWGKYTWEQIRELAIRPRLIDALDHPVLDQVLRGKK